MEPPTRLQALAKLRLLASTPTRWRDILAIADEGCLFSPAFTTQVQFKDERGLQLQSMLLPDVILADLYLRYPVAFLAGPRMLNCPTGSCLMRKFLQILAWSFKALQEGTWPSRDHRGKLILGKHLNIF